MIGSLGSGTSGPNPKIGPDWLIPGGRMTICLLTTNGVLFAESIECRDGVAVLEALAPSLCRVSLDLERPVTLFSSDGSICSAVEAREGVSEAAYPHRPKTQPTLDPRLPMLFFFWIPAGFRCDSAMLERYERLLFCDGRDEA